MTAHWPLTPTKAWIRSPSEIHYRGSFAVKGTVHRVSGAIEAGRKPGMPLSILSNIAREAPLGSLLIAFLLGVAVARRR